MFNEPPKKIPKEESGDCEIEFKETSHGTKIKIGKNCKKEQFDMAKARQG